MLILPDLIDLINVKTAIREAVLIVGEPSRRFVELAVIEVLDLGRRKWFTEDGHAFLPFRFTNDGQSLDVFPVSKVKFNIFPRGSNAPAVEVVHLKENAELAMLLDELIDDGRKRLVGLLRELAGHFHVQQFSSCNDVQ
jgi:hypothetical protein